MCQNETKLRYQNSRDFVITYDLVITSDLVVTTVSDRKHHRVRVRVEEC